MSRLEQAFPRLRAGEAAVLIDDERPAAAHLVCAETGAAPDRMAALGGGPIERVVDADAPLTAESGGRLSIASRPAVRHGVLGLRAGPAEAALDAVRLAGGAARALVARLDLPGGLLAHESAAARLAQREGLALFSAQDVVAHRLARETIVEADATARLPSLYARTPLEIQGYKGLLDGTDHVAVMHGPLGETPLVRLHSECLTGDALGSLRCDCGDQLRQALRLIGEDPAGGIVVYLRGQEGRGIGLVNKIRAYALQDLGRDTVEANEDLGFAGDLRDYGVAAQILQHLGARRVRLLSNNPAKARSLERYGIHVTERIGIGIDSNPHNAVYLETKRVKMGHDLAAGAAPVRRAAAE